MPCITKTYCLAGSPTSQPNNATFWKLVHVVSTKIFFSVPIYYVQHCRRRTSNLENPQEECYVKNANISILLCIIDNVSSQISAKYFGPTPVDAITIYLWLNFSSNLPEIMEGIANHSKKKRDSLDDCRSTWCYNNRVNSVENAAMWCRMSWWIWK